MPHALCSMPRGVTMSETLEQLVESGHEPRTRTAEFKPEILAFCCEH
jgi:hypothetical protein